MKRAQVFLAAVFAVAVMAASVILGACGGGGGGGAAAQPTPKVQLSGTISSSGYTVVAKSSPLYLARVLSYLGFASSAYAIGGPTVNEVLAIPIHNGSLSARNMPGQKATINIATGKFDLSLTKDSDWLLMLIDSNLTGTSRFVSSLALNVDPSNNMLGFPATDSTLTTMNLGTISRPTTTSFDAITSRTVGTTDFSLTTAQITAMAKTDKFFRNAMNIVNNYEQFGNGVGKYYQLRPDFHWAGSVSSLVTAGALSSAPSLTYSGMNFQMDQNTDSVTMNSVCTITGIVTLHPPLLAGTVTIGSNSYSYANPIKNSGNGCTLWNGGPAVQTDYNGIYASNGYDHISFSVIDTFASGTIPAGFWEWKENNVTKAAFDIANINPPITASGQLKGFIPAYKIVTDPTNTHKITRVDLAWYFYDGGVYTLLAPADLKVLKHFVSGVEAKFEATVGTRRTCEMYIDPSVETSFNPADPRYASTCQADSNPVYRDWYYNDPTHPQTNTGLMGFYETGGFGYFFDYR